MKDIKDCFDYKGNDLINVTIVTNHPNFKVKFIINYENYFYCTDIFLPFSV